jgi:hypothetical protein
MRNDSRGAGCRTSKAGQAFFYLRLAHKNLCKSARPASTGFLFQLTGIALLAFLGTQCQAPQPRQIAPAWYYWQTGFHLSKPETAQLDSLSCKILFVKFLDIARDPVSGEIRPYALLEMHDTSGLGQREIVPTVFVSNGVFENISIEKIDWLAQKTSEALRSVGRQFPKALPHPGCEVQFDCDWTPGTRDAFFLYLKKMRAALPPQTRLGATIRLHQYKFPMRTGVPPADRGMLMLYNTGDLDDPEEQNSIFEPEDAQKYLNGAPKNYPLPLDIALPVFSWALVYRNDEFWKILPGLTTQDFADTALFLPDTALPSSAFPPLSSPHFTVRRATFLSGHLLRPADRVRVESISSNLLKIAAAAAAAADLAPDARAAFFHLDSATVQRCPAGLLNEVCRMVAKR